LIGIKSDSSMNKEAINGHDHDHGLGPGQPPLLSHPASSLSLGLS
jgi:hypothetical protein